MTKYIFLFLASILLVGCTPNRAMQHFEKEEMYAKSLQYTNKCDILYDNQVKVMLTAVYLNSVDPKYNDDYENFIVGAYVVESNEFNEAFYNNNLFELTLNQTNVLSVEPLSHEHEIYGNIPLNNSWSNYYLVKFNPINVKLPPIKADFLATSQIKEKDEKNMKISYDLKLKLNHTTLGSCVVSFSKE
jgi:hypothetical protein